MKVSFCITCKNRFHQVSKTLPKNLQDNYADQNSIEFILVDFDSKDGLKDWVLSNFQKELASGYLKYFFTESLPNWDCSLAKNSAHLFATGNILVNLDCDNFTGPNGGVFVSKQFDKYGERTLLHQFRGDPKDGSYGRIAMMKRYFEIIGGYDQQFEPMGYQDTDLIFRLVKLGLIYTPQSNLLYNRALRNTKDEGLRYTNSSASYNQMNHTNKRKSMENILTAHILANNGQFGIQTNVLQYLNGRWINAMSV